MAEDKYSAEALLAKEKEVELDTNDRDWETNGEYLLAFQ